MAIGVLDVGSNTCRLLVATVDGGTVVPLEKARVRLPLGEEIELTGGVTEATIEAAASAARKLSGIARQCGVDILDVFVTAPGRQSANADELVAALRQATQHSVRVLSPEEEGSLSYKGAMATADIDLRGSVAVCDVGGASTEIATGPPHGRPEWIASVDLGSIRLAARAESPAEAMAVARSAFEGIAVEPVETALCVGGTARATRRLVGPWLDEAALEEAFRIVEATPPEEISRRFGVASKRARLLPAGVAILAQVHRLLGVPLRVCDGGVREGAVLAVPGGRAA